jgi:hypothetical protein
MDRSHRLSFVLSRKSKGVDEIMELHIIFSAGHCRSKVIEKRTGNSHRPLSGKTEGITTSIAFTPRKWRLDGINESKHPTDQLHHSLRNSFS